MPEVPAATGAGPAPEDGAPGDRLVRLGVVVTGIGMLISLVAILPLVTDLELPSTFWWLSMLTGDGPGCTGGMGPQPKNSEQPTMTIMIFAQMFFTTNR